MAFSWSGTGNSNNPSIEDNPVPTAESNATVSDGSIIMIPESTIQAQGTELALTRVMSPSPENPQGNYPIEVLTDDQFLLSLGVSEREEFCVMEHYGACPVCTIPVQSPVICAQCGKWGHMSCLGLRSVDQRDRDNILFVPRADRRLK